MPRTEWAGEKAKELPGLARSSREKQHKQLRRGPTAWNRLREAGVAKLELRHPGHNRRARYDLSVFDRVARCERLSRTSSAPGLVAHIVQPLRNLVHFDTGI